MKLQWKRTKRGFQWGLFFDSNGKKCSIQKSSVATVDALWLGTEEPMEVDGIVLSRMHLTQEQVGALLPILQYFVETGELPEDDPSSEYEDD